MGTAVWTVIFTNLGIFFSFFVNVFTNFTVVTVSWSMYCCSLCFGGSSVLWYLWWCICLTVRFAWLALGPKQCPALKTFAILKPRKNNQKRCDSARHTIATFIPRVHCIAIIFEDDTQLWSALFLHHSRCKFPYVSIWRFSKRALCCTEKLLVCGRQFLSKTLTFRLPLFIWSVLDARQASPSSFSRNAGWFLPDVLWNQMQKSEWLWWLFHCIFLLCLFWT